MVKWEHNWGLCRKCGKDHGLPPFSGRHHSNETKEKISVSQKGIPESEETREKMSVAYRGEGNGFYGKHHSKGARIRVSEKKKEQWANGVYDEHGEKMKAQWADPEKRGKWIVKIVAGSNTPEVTTIEVMLRAFLDNNTIPYSTEKVIDIGYKLRRPDAFIEPNIIIEADGRYFHGENCYGKNHKAEDERDDKVLKEMGYIIYRIPERDFRDGKYLEILNGIATKHKP